MLTFNVEIQRIIGSFLVGIKYRVPEIPLDASWDITFRIQIACKWKMKC